MESFILQNFNTELMEFYFCRIAIKNNRILFCRISTLEFYLSEFKVMKFYFAQYFKNKNTEILFYRISFI